MPFIEKQNFTPNFNTFSKNNKSLLYLIINAAFSDKSYFSFIHYLVDHEALLRDSEKTNSLLLRELSKNENLEILKYLITHTIISANAISDSGKSLVSFALDNNSFATVEFLLEHGATMTEEDTVLLEEKKLAAAAALLIIQAEEAALIL